MTAQINFLTATSSLKMAQLKAIATAWNLNPVGDKRLRQTWIDAIETERRRRVIAAAPVAGLSDIEQGIYNVLVSKVYRNFKGEAGVAMAKYLARVSDLKDADRTPQERRSVRWFIQLAAAS